MLLAYSPELNSKQIWGEGKRGATLGAMKNQCRSGTPTGIKEPVPPPVHQCFTDFFRGRVLAKILKLWYKISIIGA